jgi:hypothetical protein
MRTAQQGQAAIFSTIHCLTLISLVHHTAAVFYLDYMHAVASLRACRTGACQLMYVTAYLAHGADS